MRRNGPTMHRILYLLRSQLSFFFTLQHAHSTHAVASAIFTKISVSQIRLGVNRAVSCYMQTMEQRSCVSRPPASRSHRQAPHALAYRPTLRVTTRVNYGKEREGNGRILCPLRQFLLVHAGSICNLYLARCTDMRRITTFRSTTDSIYKWSHKTMII